MQLQPDQPQALDAARTGEVRVVAGIVWLTVAGETTDIFLHAGDSYRLPGRGRIMVEAIHGPARLSLANAVPSEPTFVARWRNAWFRPETPATP
jgi:hypothetical protein